MATRLDLGEQEQLDTLKDFWKQYGSLITWVLILAMAAFAGFSGYQWWQRDRAAKAGALFDELDRAVQAQDVERTARVFGDMKERFAGTTYADQAGLLAAKLQFDKSQPDAAKATLAWVAAEAGDPQYRVIAQLRLAGVLLDQKQPDEAFKQLPSDPPKAFAALVADRRGDVLTAQGKPAEAKAAYQQAFDAMTPQDEYRRLVEAKLTAAGSVGASAVAPAASGAADAAPAAASAPAAGASR